jgi:type II secretion system protein N
MATLRLPMPRLSLGRLDELGGRRVLLYAVYTLFLFFIFLIANFPHDVLVKRALRAVDLGPVALTVERARFAWFKGYEFGGVQLNQHPRDPAAPPLLESSSLYVRPGLDGLIHGKVESLFAKGAFYGGTLDASWRQGDGVTRAGLQLSRVQIGRYGYLTAMLGEDGHVGGQLSGAVTFEARGDPRGGRAAGELQIEGAGLQGVKVNGFAAPDVNLGQVSVKFTVQGSRLEIEELHADGDLKINGSGQVVLRAPVSDSVLNLKGTIVAAPDSPDAIKGLASLVPHPNGARPDAPVTISGTLKFPRFK